MTQLQMLAGPLIGVLALVTVNWGLGVLAAIRPPNTFDVRELARILETDMLPVVALAMLAGLTLVSARFPVAGVEVTVPMAALYAGLATAKAAGLLAELKDKFWEIVLPPVPTAPPPIGTA